MAAMPFSPLGLRGSSIFAEEKKVSGVDGLALRSIRHSGIETDQLIVGAGAQGLIFTDEAITHTDANIILVDRRDRVGGH